MVPLKNTDVFTDIAMTHTQVALLFESQLSNKPALNVLQVVLRFSSVHVDHDAMKKAWEALAQRHDALRITLQPLNYEAPVQHLYDAGLVDFECQHIDCPLEAWLETDRRAGLPLDQHPNWRVRLLTLDDGTSAMVWSFHHALLDGGGYRILLRDLFAHYTAFRDHTPLSPLPLGPRFVDHCQAVAEIDHAPARQFFQGYLAGFDTPNVLDPVFSPNEDEKAAADPQTRRSVSARLSAELSQDIRDRATSVGATTTNMISAAWGLVLARCSGRDEAVFGLTRSGRHLLRNSGLSVGCQINTLPCRVSLSGATLDGLLRSLRSYNLETRPFEHTPLTEIAKVCDVPREAAIFQSIVMVDRGSLPVQMKDLDPASGELRVDEVSQMATPLSLSAYDDPEMLLRFDYDPAVLSDEAAKRVFGYVQTALSSMANAATDRPLTQIDILPEDEVATLLARGVPTNPTTDDTSVVNVFERTVALYPDKRAVYQIDQPGALTFAELDARANHVAQCLKNKGVQPGEIVGIALNRSIDFIVALMAILKADAAFLPLDPSYPASSLQDMVTRSDARVVFTSPTTRAAFSDLDLDLIDVFHADFQQQASAAPQRAAHDPNRRAYVIFTSGSTGKPKGVEVSHRALAHHASAITDLFALSNVDRVLQFASLNFDVSIEEIMPTLLAGATLVLRNDDVAQSVSSLMTTMEEHRITVSNLPTAFWHILVAHLIDAGKPPGMCKALRLVIVGGERVSGEMLERWLQICPDIRWLNCYGPTEATITSTYYDASDPPYRGGDVPIGRPTGHARTYIVGPDGSLAPDGVAGELWIGGPAVALGYLGQPDQTEALFMPDPWNDGGRIYRSGDKTAWTRNHGVAYFGRIDRQIKLRGHRIELSAIEAQIEATPGVSVAVAGLDNAGSETARILAWVKPDDTEFSAQAVTEALAQALPAHMLPTIIPVDDFPTTPGGKVDVSALPRPALNDAPSDADEPADAGTQRVQAIFRELLGREAVGPDQSFFDLGGHSLLSVRLMSLIQREFGKRMSLATLYQSPTPRQIAAELAGHSGDMINAIVPIQPLGSRPPLFAVHILGERASFFKPLSDRLGVDQPVIGLTMDLLDPSAPTTIPDIAAEYAKNINAYAPEGAVSLIAVSQGSHIAFELAHHLLAEGRDVAGLYLLDAEGPGGRPKRVVVKSPGYYLHRLRKNFRGVIFGRIERLKMEIGFRIERFRLALARRGVGVSIATERNNTSAHQAAIDLAIALYSPSEYPRQITVFRARENDTDTPEGIASGLGWNVVAPAGVRVIESAGDHLTMLQNPHVRELAAHLRPLLPTGSENQRSV